MQVESISDQKRLVRAEQWIFARRFLRSRDCVHHAKWKLLIVAGPCPSEEIGCIKELMPKAHITTIDINEANILAAIAAGSDEVAVHNLSEFDRAPAINGAGTTQIPSSKLGKIPFDAVCLDLTGHVSNELVKLIKVYFANLAKGGVLIVTFSYGRDVTEFFDEHWRRLNMYREERAMLEQIGMPEPIRNRIAFLLGNKIRYVQSVLQYRGGAMPMVSLLMIQDRRRREGAKFKSIIQGDFEAAVSAENLGNIYACPADRIEALRRSKSAHKAVATRKMRALSAPPKLLAPPEKMPTLLEYFEGK